MTYKYNISHIKLALLMLSTFLLTKTTHCQYLAAAIGKNIKIIDLSQQPDQAEYHKILQGHTELVNSVKFHPTNKNIIVSSSRDGIIRVWDISKQPYENGYCKILQGHTQWIYSVKFHPTNENIIVSSSQDRTSRVWNISKQPHENGYCKILQYNSYITRIAFSPHIHIKEEETREDEHTRLQMISGPFTTRAAELEAISGNTPEQTEFAIPRGEIALQGASSNWQNDWEEQEEEEGEVIIPIARKSINIPLSLL